MPLLLSLACATGDRERSRRPEVVGLEDVGFVVGPSGTGAFVVAPERAEVHAQPDRVRVEAGHGLAVELRRERVDLQDQQVQVIAEQPFLREFTVHDSRTLVWRWGWFRDWYHFVHKGEREGVAFSCRSVADRRYSRAAIETMLEACATVEHVDGPVVPPRHTEAVPGGRPEAR